MYEEIGLFDEFVENHNYSVKKISQSFIVTGRLDSEYYQEKYDNLFLKLEKKQTKKLKSLVDIQKSVEPGSEYYRETGVPFIRVSDINKYGISEPNVYLPSSYAKTITIRPKKDTVLLTKDGSIGIAYKVAKDLDVITSGAILHLKVKNPNEILPEYLNLVLNSIAVKMQAERDAGGSIIEHWRVSDIEKVIIPIIDMEKQIEISSLIDESFELKKKSEQLLDIAKKAVEIAIEKGEEIALEYIERQAV